MINPTLRIGLLIGMVYCLCRVCGELKSLRGTQLRPAAWLVLLGILAWTFAMAMAVTRDWGAEGREVGQLTGIHPRDGLIDMVRYLAVLLILGGGISVLGARSPGAEAWTWFVVGPMFLVLGWPAFLSWGTHWMPLRLDLMSPAYLGILLVGIMGGGNYLGTRHQLAAASLLMAVGVTTLSRTTWGWLGGWFGEGTEEFLTLLGDGLVCVSLILFLTSRESAARTRLERFWLDFRDYFGMVWSYRVMERLNQEGKRLNWPLRFELEGVFVKEGEEGAAMEDLSAETRGELEFALQWIFRRFVSEEWCLFRLGGEKSLSENS